MTDSSLVAKKLAFIETCVQEVRTLGRPQEIRTDLRERRFIEHTLQIAIQAALDVASHIISDGRLGEPRTNREMFFLLGRYGWIPGELSLHLENMAGFRNVVVHGYDLVDIGILEDVLAHRLDDLLAFAAAIRARL